MINQEDLIFKTEKYYTPGYSGVAAVVILKFLSDEKLLVKSGEYTFIRNIKYIYSKPQCAKRGKRAWEHDERKRKRRKKH